MGKGDPKTRRGKIFKGTYGKHRKARKQSIVLIKADEVPVKIEKISEPELVTAIVDIPVETPKESKPKVKKATTDEKKPALKKEVSEKKESTSKKEGIAEKSTADEKKPALKKEPAEKKEPVAKKESAPKKEVQKKPAEPKKKPAKSEK